MKVIMHKDELSRALFRVQGVADKKSSMPILAHALCQASEEGSLTISATDLDVGLSGSYKAEEVQEAGSLAIHARQFYDVVKSLPEDKIELSRQDNHWLELRCGSSHFKLVGMAADEFPTMGKHGGLETFEVATADLIRLIDRTLFCVSTDDSRHNLSGVFCEAYEGNTLRFVATDGHRLGLADLEMNREIALSNGVIVPRKGFQELRRVLSDQESMPEVIQMGFSNTHGVFDMGTVSLTTRLVEGQFPEYTQVIPSSSGQEVKISRTAFSDALRRVSLISQSRAHGVRLQIQQGSMELVAEHPDLGRADESIPIEYSGKPITIGFNARYILDVLALIKDEGVVLVLTDDLSPGILKPLEESAFLAVVMPMRI